MIHCGTKIIYIYVRNPKLNKMFFWNFTALLYDEIQDFKKLSIGSRGNSDDAFQSNISKFLVEFFCNNPGENSMK